MTGSTGAPLAAFVTPGSSLGKAAQRASIAETLGYDLVLDNHTANRDGLVSLTTYGATTSTVRLATGVYPALLQSPLSLAQQAATVDEILRGRLVLGLGTSHRPVIEGWHGLEFPDDPIGVMREIVTVVRALFTEGSVDFSGDHLRVAFGFQGFTPRADIPIHLAALSPAMLRLAGEVADGVILWLCDPDYVRETVVPSIAEGARQAGRDPAQIEIVAAITCSVADDPEPVLAKFRRTLIPYLSLPFYRAMLERAGHSEDLERFDAGMADGDVNRALDGVSDKMLHTIAGIGTEADVRKKLDEYRDAGVTLPGVGPLTADGTLRFEQILAVAAGHDLAAATA